MGSEELPKDDFIGFEVNSELKDAAQHAAKRDGRSLSNYMRNLLRRQLEVERRVFGTEAKEAPHTFATT